jgi:simple sugar transport system substrate-binding protein
VVSINSGSDVYRRFGVLAHVGQPEERAGFEAGRRLAAAGARRVLCVNQQIGNQGLDARCRGLSRAMRGAGGRARVLGVDDQSPATPRRIADAIRSGGIDGVLALNATSGIEAVKAARRIDPPGAVKVATFDLGPDVLRAVRAHQLLFAVDQQAYLQGYLPIVLLTERARYGLFPAQGDVLPTGPNFVTARDAGKAIELSKRSIR